KWCSRLGSEHCRLPSGSLRPDIGNGLRPGGPPHSGASGYNGRMEIERRVALKFHPDAVAASTHVNLSAVRSDGGCLWLEGDETATVERLTPEESGFGAQREFR